MEVCDNPPPNLKNSQYRRAIEDFAGRQEELSKLHHVENVLVFSV